MRVVYKQKVKPEFLDEYLQYHQEVWPELVAVYKEAGVTDISCFINNHDLLVFFEYDRDIFNQKKEWLDKNNVEIKWQKIMSGFKDDNYGTSTFEEVYRFPG